MIYSPGGRLLVMVGGLGGVRCVGETTGLFTGGRVGLAMGDEIGEGDAMGLGLVRGEGVGDEVRKLAFKFILKLKLLGFTLAGAPLKLKLKFESNPILVFR